MGGEWKADWEREIEGLFNAWIKDIKERYGVSEEKILESMVKIASLKIEQIIANNHYENSTVIHKAEKVHVGDVKKIQIVRDETKYASPEELQSIRELVNELVELIEKALAEGIPKTHLRLDFRIGKNPYPSIYSELQSRCRYPNFKLLPKERIPCVKKWISGWITNVAGVLYKNGIPPYDRNVMIKKFYSACYSAGRDPREEALRRWGTDNFGEIDLLEMFKAYRSLRSNRRK
ncbi:MAG: hypothetical protein ABGX12_02710 [Desulfurobacteriaceae bacterium]